MATFPMALFIQIASHPYKTNGCSGFRTTLFMDWFFVVRLSNRSFVQTPSHGMIYLLEIFLQCSFWAKSVAHIDVHLMVGSSKGSFTSPCSSLATTAISTWWSEDHWKLDSRQPQLQLDSTIIIIT